MTGSLFTPTLPLFAPRGTSLRHLLAALLRSASVRLAQLSRRLAAAERERQRSPAEMVLEFYAEAGAPEGALYLDGQLIGYLPGVTRL
ncbi:MAG: hypothetical protein HYX43_19370 [Burkholderiales bacterium]|nr:hypothetical protein [Burkholderiales bacterium]